MTVRYVDPRAPIGVPEEAYGLAADLSGPVVLGVLTNGFPDSERFGDHLAAALGTCLPAADVRVFHKADASSIAPAQVLDGIAAECAAAVTLYGH